MKKDTKKPVSETRLFAMTLLAHGGAASLSRVLVAPLDRVKVIMQTQEHFHKENVLKPAGWRACFSGVYRHQGIRSFWWGFGPHCSAALLTTGVRLIAFQKLGLFCLPGGDDAYGGIEKVVRLSACYFFSSAVALSLFYPLDVMYTRLATDEGKSGAHTQRIYPGFFRGMKHTIVETGFQALYRGYWFTLCGSLPFLAVTLPCHALLSKIFLPPPTTTSASSSTPKHTTDSDATLSESEKRARRLRALLDRSQETTEVKISYPPDENETQVAAAEQLRYFPNNLLLGVASGFLGQTVCYPVDTIRRRYQYDGADPRTGYEPKYRSIREFMWNESFNERITHKNGTVELRRVPTVQWLRSHYAGWSVLAIKTVPECAMLCAFYWLIKQTIG